MRLSRPLFRLAGFSVMTATLALGSCASPNVLVVTDRPKTELLFIRRGIALEFTPSIDRITFFGPEKGTNMLHTVDLDKPIPMDGSYTFWGGAYSWVAPQKGENGWRDDAGQLKDWPPDPAMDIGPTEITGESLESLTVEGPVMRSGLQEIKTFRSISATAMDISYTLKNTTDHPVTGGQWLNTACRAATVFGKESKRGTGGDKLAFRIMAGTDSSHIRGAMSDKAVELFQSASAAATQTGWVVLDLNLATWDDGIKVYIDPPAGRKAEIAIWHDGYWLHRELTIGDENTDARLAQMGEGAVAVYINPGLKIVEAELYAPITEIPAGNSTTATERWTLIKAASGDARVLPE